MSLGLSKHNASTSSPSESWEPAWSFILLSAPDNMIIVYINAAQRQAWCMSRRITGGLGRSRDTFHVISLAIMSNE